MKKNSLTTTIFGLMLTFILLSSVLATLSLITLSYSLGDARAINASGSLRMQSYRLLFYVNTEPSAVTEKINQFEQTLFSTALKRSLDPLSPQALVTQYQIVIDKWQVMKHHIEHDNIPLYTASLKDFVDKIDLLVLETEHYAALKLKLLTIIQATGLGLMLLIAFIAVKYTKRKVVRPLDHLVSSANTISKGNFNLSMPKTDYVELSSLSHALESTAKELSTLYGELESQVEEKTQALTRANGELSLLYDILVMLHSRRLDINALQKALNQLLTHEPQTFIRLTISQDSQQKQVIIAETGWPDDDKQAVTFPLKFEDNELGYLEVISNSTTRLFYQNFAIMLARSIISYTAAEQQQQLALMEERAVIARELHDSLGQLLSFLKIQVNLLSKEIPKQHRTKNVEQQLTEINHGVNTAYQQLRELLSTFRLTIKDPNLNQAMQVMLEQLDNQTEVSISFDYQLPERLLGAHQHIHVLQLTREATLNAIKHAQANNISIKCYKSTDSSITICIDDDGIGIDNLVEREQHFGIGIMHERASKLSGIVKFDSNAAGGTRVTLTFPPQQQPAEI